MVEPATKEDFAVEAQAIAAHQQSEYSAKSDTDVGDGALDKQVVRHIADSAATCQMTPDGDGLTNYRECSRPLGFANGGEVYIVGYDLPPVTLRTDNGWVRIELNKVSHAPLLHYHLISLPTLAINGNTYVSDSDVVALGLEGGGNVFPPSSATSIASIGTAPRRQVGLKTLIVLL